MADRGADHRLPRPAPDAVDACRLRARPSGGNSGPAAGIPGMASITASALPALLAVVLLVAGCGGGGGGGGGEGPTPPDPGPGGEPVAAGDKDATAVIGGHGRTWRVHVPSDVRRGRPVPVIYVLHGMSGTGIAAQQGYGFDAFAEAHGFVVVYPDGYEKSWNDGRPNTPAAQAGIDDVAFLDAIDADLRTWLDPDDDRIYVCGMSNGAIMSHRLAVERSARFAAIGAVCGQVSETIAALPAPAGAVSAVLVLGTADRSWAGGDPNGLGPVLSATAMFDLYRTRAGTGDPVSTPLPDLAPGDGATATRLASSGGAGSRTVWLYRIDCGGHCWPGRPGILDFGANCRDIDATAALVEFFLAHPRPGPSG